MTTGLANGELVIEKRLALMYKPWCVDVNLNPHIHQHGSHLSMLVNQRQGE